MASIPDTPIHPFSPLPHFDAIRKETLATIVDALIGRLQQRVAALTARSEYTFDALVNEHQDILHELARTWSPISNLNMVRSDRDWHDEYREALARITEFSTALAQNRAIYEAYAALAQQLGDSASGQQRELVRHVLRDFELSGIALDADGQQRYRELRQSQSAAEAAFANNLQQCTDAWSWHTTNEGAVAGIPAPILRQARSAARARGEDGWRFGLTQPEYMAVVTHACDRGTRERFYRAWMTRATAAGEHDPQWDNTALIERILSIRVQVAELLGFASFADYSLAAKMADSTDEVLDFLYDLAERSDASARRELEALEAFAGHALAPWDIGFYTEQLKERRFKVSDNLLRPYFPVDRVLDGLFRLAGRLYGVAISERHDIATWHPDVRFLEVTDASGAPVGGFFADLLARDGKRSGAWIDECVVRKSFDGSTTLPVGYLVCNFTPATADQPSLLTHDDVVTLFHEFGHMLHHLLTRVDYPGIAGINGVPWDAVELPSQFMEHYAWHYDVLRTCSAHVESGAELPAELFDKLYAARNVGAGMRMLRQLEYSLFDFQLHARTDAMAPGVVETVLAETRALTAPVAVPSWSRFQNGFSHIFAGGYAAGYYSYKWAEVLAADAFSAFVESGDVLDATTAQRFREEILEVGGSRDIHEAFIAFRGRAPKIDALLLNAGIISD